jgi:CTP:molybdopterin cytidylyltransferase MocA
MRVAAILLAAGSSRRFGGAKLLAPWRGRPLFEHALEALASSPGITETIAVVQPGFPPWPERPGVRRVENGDHAEGMGASVRAGVAAAAAGTDAYVVALADMPGIRPELVTAMLDRLCASGRSIVVPECGGRRGHPVVFAGRHREALLALTGDVGARELLRAHPGEVERFVTDDEGVLFDVDRPIDLGDPA